MAWYYHLNGNTVGPVEAPQLLDLLHQGVVQTDTLVWSEGMAQWTPFRNSTVADSGPVIPGASQKCAECGQRFPEAEMLHYENMWVCTSCKPIFFQRVKEGAVPRGLLDFASIGNRFVAVVIDVILIMVVSIILMLPLYISLFSQFSQLAKHPNAPFKPPAMSVAMNIYSNVVSYGLPAAYEIYFLGTFGATLGKMAMRVKVVRPDGAPISYALATGRHFAKYISAITICIGFGFGYWMACFDDEKRALHDRICNTRVVVNGA